MSKFGIIGSNSTHFCAYAKALIAEGATIYLLRDSFNPKLIDFDYIEMPDRSSLLNSINTVLLTHRFGDEHYSELKKLLSLLNSRNVVFIDKPLCSSTAELDNICTIRNDLNCRFVSFSPLTYAKETFQAAAYINYLIGINADFTVKIECPFECKDLGNDFRLRTPLFYGIHATEISMQLKRLCNLIFKSYSVLDKTIQIFFENVKSPISILLRDSEEEFYQISIGAIDRDISEYIIRYKLDASYYHECAKVIIGDDNNTHLRCPPFEDNLLATRMLLNLS
jgi:hypothetical protein